MKALIVPEGERRVRRLPGRLRWPKAVEDQDEQSLALVLGERGAHAHGPEQLHEIGSVEILAHDAGGLGPVEHDAQRADDPLV